MRSKNIAIIVAHPDDETLWAGGTILINHSWNCFIVCMCRGNDADRAPRFFRTLDMLLATGVMGDLDDEPGQFPLVGEKVENAILDLLLPQHFDLVITHNPSGEYTRHRRHEEVSKAVIQLWKTNKISVDRLWTFAYEDGDKQYYPRPIAQAPVQYWLTKRIWMKKYKIITEIYGFEKGSWEAETTPKSEAFWEFSTSDDAMVWLKHGGIKL